MSTEHPIHWQGTPAGVCPAKDDHRDQTTTTQANGTTITQMAECTWMGNTTCPVCLAHIGDDIDIYGLRLELENTMWEADTPELRAKVRKAWRHLLAAERADNHEEAQRQAHLADEACPMPE